MARNRSRVITAVTAFAAAAGVALAVALTAEGSSQPRSTHPELDLNHGLLVSTRTEFRVCVQLDPELVGPERRATIERDLLVALDRVREHPHWQQAYGEARYDRSDVLAWGCPAPRLPERYEPRSAVVVGPGLTAEPSPYRIWVYVLGEATGNRVLGASGAPRVATAEAMNDGPRSTFPVSSGLLIRRLDLADPARAAGYLGEAAGLART